MELGRTCALTDMRLSDMTRLGATLRGIGAGARSTEEVAGRTVRLLYDNFFEPGSKTRSCVLVRFYITTKYSELDEGLRAFGAKLMHGHEILPTTRCLTLLGTAGDEPAWNDRRSSAGHASIPLPSEESVRAFPMISQLIAQLGLHAGTVVTPDPSLILDLEQRTYSVFFVPQAAGSPYIPAQSTFVVPYRVRSVLGFGGLLPSGDVYAVLMFARVPITRVTADIFRNAAMNLKVSLLSFLDGPLFAEA